MRRRLFRDIDCSAYPRIMNIFVLAIIIGHLAVVAFGSDVRDKLALSHGNSVDRSGKYLSLFSVVTFQNSVCVGKSDSTMMGTCYTASECSTKGGTSDGNCAAGFGVCCMFTLSSCSTTVSQNCTYLQNPSYPSSTSLSSCSYTVSTIQTDICQIRLDFSKFDIVDTVPSGACSDTMVVTSPTGATIPTLCGILTGQHMYYEVAGTTSSTIAFTLSTTASGNKFWKIKVSQIECWNTGKAPTDCRQYFTGASGSFKSYNFNGGALLQSQLTNICIRREQGYCRINYAENDSTSPDSYYVGGPYPATGVTANYNSANCPLAYITFDQIISPAGQSMYCGTVLVPTANQPAAISSKESTPGVVTAMGSPFIVTLTTQASTQVGNGFYLDYYQVPCM